MPQLRTIIAHRFRVLIPGFPPIKCTGSDARRLADDLGGQIQQSRVTVHADGTETLGAWRPAVEPLADWERELLGGQTIPDPPAPALLMTTHELLQVVTGHPVTVAATNGADVVIRLATVDELLESNERARSALIASGAHPSPATIMSREQAEELVRPLDPGCAIGAPTGHHAGPTSANTDLGDPYAHRPTPGHRPPDRPTSQPTRPANFWGAR